MDLQLKAPKGIPKSKSLATYEEWKQHERQLRRSKSYIGGPHGLDNQHQPQQKSPQKTRTALAGGGQAGPTATTSTTGRGGGGGGGGGGDVVGGSNNGSNQHASGNPNGLLRQKSHSTTSSSVAAGSDQMSMASVGRRASGQSDSTSNGMALLDEHGIVEYATLELRVHPPSVKIDNTLDDKSTVVIVDSANRPGTLVEVVERLTELGLGVKNAQISSDGGWFVDVFHVTNAEGEKVRDRRTLERIENILDLDFDISPGVPSYEYEGGMYQGMNVIEMMLEDEPGLLSRVSKQITSGSGCQQLNIYDMLLWTHKGYAAMLFTVSVLESGQPICMEKDLHELQLRLEEAIGIREEEEEEEEEENGKFTNGGTATTIPHLNGDVKGTKPKQKKKKQKKKMMFINVDCCYDTLYVEKRFYRLKMRTFSIIYDQQQMQQSATTTPSSSHHLEPNEKEKKNILDQVTSRFDPQTRYTTFHLVTRDRPQLLFDTVCTLSDLGIDVFHATIDTDDQMANLEFFVKSSSGAEIREEGEMQYIKRRLGMALAFGAPAEALCLQVAGRDNKGMLHRISKEFMTAGLDIAYCTSRTDPIEMQTCCIFYVLDAKDRTPAKFDLKLEACCKSIGAKCLSSGFSKGNVMSLPTFAPTLDPSGKRKGKGKGKGNTSFSSTSKASGSLFLPGVKGERDNPPGVVHQDMAVLESSWNKLWQGI